MVLWRGRGNAATARTRVAVLRRAGRAVNPGRGPGTSAADRVNANDVMRSDNDVTPVPCTRVMDYSRPRRPQPVPTPCRRTRPCSGGGGRGGVDWRFSLRFYYAPRPVRDAMLRRSEIDGTFMFSPNADHFGLGNFRKPRANPDLTGILTFDIFSRMRTTI